MLALKDHVKAHGDASHTGEIDPRNDLDEVFCPRSSRRDLGHAVVERVLSRNKGKHLVLLRVVDDLALVLLPGSVEVALVLLVCVSVDELGAVFQLSSSCWR